MYCGRMVVVRHKSKQIRDKSSSSVGWLCCVVYRFFVTLLLHCDTLIMPIDKLTATKTGWENGVNILRNQVQTGNKKLRKEANGYLLLHKVQGTVKPCWRCNFKRYFFIVKLSIVEFDYQLRSKKL